MNRALAVASVAVVLGGCATGDEREQTTRVIAAQAPDGGQFTDPTSTSTSAPPRTTTTRPSRSHPRPADSGQATLEQLDALAQCESGGDARALSRNGLFRGAYQWHQRSWDAHTERLADLYPDRGYRDLVGVDPRTLTYETQRDVTSHVPLSAWRHQFPTCSRLIGVAR